MRIMGEPLGEARFFKETGAAAAIAELSEPVLESLGYRLVLARIMGGQGGQVRTVEILAERPDGSMAIEDCETISRTLSPLLDVHDPVSGAYLLQVSSPGIDRPLVRPSDFERWSGFEAKIETRELIGGRRRFRGLLEGFADGEVRIEVDLAKEGRQVLGLPVTMIEEARLVLTEALVRESLRQAKRSSPARDDVADAPPRGSTDEEEAAPPRLKARRRKR